MTQAIKYHKQELTISKEVNDRSSEASTHGNLAVAYQALNMHDIGNEHSSEAYTHGNLAVAVIMQEVCERNLKILEKSGLFINIILSTKRS